jgi:hypothetical protein
MNPPSSFCFRSFYSRDKLYYLSADPSKIPLLGDALVIAGTICYAFTNIGQVGDLLYFSATVSNFSQNF